MKFEIDTLQVGKATIHTLKYENFAIKDAEFFLNVEEKNKLQTFGSDTRRMEFAATRILKHQLVGFKQIEYSEIGAPFIEDFGFISVSHAKHLVGIALSPEYPVGFDLEPIRKKILNIYPKFLGLKDEMNPKLTQLRNMTMLWSGKECLYKLAGRKKIIFKEELIIRHLNGDQYKGTIINPTGILSGELRIFEKEQIIYSINNSPFEYQK